MAKLVLSMDGVVIHEYLLNKERTTLGRKITNDVQVDNLAVSGEHAVIFTLLNDSFIEDLNSTNGTFVNGKPVRRHLLQHGDIIELGKHKLKYVNDGKSEFVADYERTMSLRSSMTRPPFDQSSPPLDIDEVRRSAIVPPTTAVSGEIPISVPSLANDANASNGLPLGVIQVLNGAAAGRNLDLSKDLTTIGKSGGDVAVVTRRPSGYFITPVEGKPPLLNGQALSTQAHPLQDHDIIEMSGVKLEFYLKT
ncbi:MAG TPA: FHA domain-containing protein [Burkholderiales bacterium]|nr:FHA domain-containing protein [Burkholderiales bacterium]